MMSTEAPRAALFHNITSIFDRNFSDFFLDWVGNLKKFFIEMHHVLKKKEKNGKKIDLLKTPKNGF